MRAAPLIALIALAACGADGPPAVPPAAGSVAEDRALVPGGSVATEGPSVTVSGDARTGVVFSE